jgi:predicted O-methyltransferase YrrM/predicted  nucleic acid-binding Zn-ribbon protein
MHQEQQNWNFPDQVDFLLQAVQPYTLLDETRLKALIAICNYLNAEEIQGDFVECGTDKGGCAAVLSKYLNHDRCLWLYDSFLVLPEASEKDGEEAKDGTGKCHGTIADIQKVMQLVATPSEDYIIKQGCFHDTFATESPAKVALLHCYADWYISVTEVLEKFYPLIPDGGCVVLDDFACWEGCREAFYDFCQKYDEKPVLERIGVTQAFWIKGKSHNSKSLILPDSMQNSVYTEQGSTEADSQVHALQTELAQSQARLRQVEQELLRWQSKHLISLDLPQSQEFVKGKFDSSDLDLFPAGDYVSPGMVAVKLDRCFPRMVIGNPEDCRWPFLRGEVPHNWYVDVRHPIVGFINRDEVHILFNNALKFQGKRALEVGCWMGWSTCHLALAGLHLDVIDPILVESEFYDSITQSLEMAGVRERVQLIPGSSPEQVEAFAKETKRRWSFIFIDGNHEAPGPYRDAVICEQFADDDAMIVFHDLVAPDVADGLNYLQKKGWKTRIYQTAQIIGVAWRGNVEPVSHQPDPTVYWTLPNHLRRYAEGATLEPSGEQDLQDTLLRFQSQLEWLRLRWQASKAEIVDLNGHKDWFAYQLQLTQGELDHFRRSHEQFEEMKVQLQSAQFDLQTAQSNLADTQSKLDQAQVQLTQTQLELADTKSRWEQNRNVLAHLQSQLLKTQTELEQKQTQVQRQDENLQRAQSEAHRLAGRIAAMETSKFWKLRIRWFQLKRLLGLPLDE